MLPTACLLLAQLLVHPFFPLSPLNELHWVEFRQSTPSCGPLVNVNPSSWELKEYLSSPTFFILCAFVAKSLNDCIAFCLQAKRAVQRGATAVIFDVSENPDAIDQVGALLRNDTALVLQQHWNGWPVCE